ncbi:hypothetical protein [Gallibacterium anatis]|uniref:hypothetical protein n=1 Tax=Gallibacterium anatis TaxID=750 RepID=UPI000802811C|nr:hypothetical protein [Gallibacterium anatis]OBW92685.1 hypothetical protein QV02_10015 [Gallibacterium anatis]
MKYLQNILGSLACCLMSTQLLAAQPDATQLSQLKANYQRSFTQDIPYKPIVWLGERYEADALLELASTGINVEGQRKYLIPSEEIVLVMPRIDLLSKNIRALAKTTKHLYLFVMSDDKFTEPYGDRSWETLMKSGLAKKLPSNVKLFKLENDSVTPTGDRNNFEYPTEFMQSAVFKKQVKPKFEQVTTVYSNIPRQ